MGMTATEAGWTVLALLGGGALAVLVPFGVLVIVGAIVDRVKAHREGR